MKPSLAVRLGSSALFGIWIPEKRPSTLNMRDIRESDRWKASSRGNYLKSKRWSESFCRTEKLKRAKRRLEWAVLNLTNNREMTIAIDYDKTWTEDPHMWNKVSKLMISYNHRVIIATGRKDFGDDMKRGLEGANLPIVFCGDKTKRQGCLERGFKVDVWIDDMPAMIDGGLLVNVNNDEL